MAEDAEDSQDDQMGPEPPKSPLESPHGNPFTAEDLLLPIPDLEHLSAEQTADVLLRCEMHYQEQILKPLVQGALIRLKIHIELDDPV